MCSDLFKPMRKSKIGFIRTPHPRYSAIKDIKTLRIPSYAPSSMVIVEKWNQIIISDVVEKSLRVFDMDGTHVKCVNLIACQMPKSVCVNESTGQVFVLDSGTIDLFGGASGAKILVHDSSFKLLRFIFQLSNPEFISFDKVTSNLYVGEMNYRGNDHYMEAYQYREYYHNSCDILVIDSNTGDIIRSIFCAKKVFFMRQTKQSMILSTSDGFLIISKLNYEIEKTIIMDLCVKFFDIFDSNFILTVKQDFNFNYSLVSIDSDGNEISETKLPIDLEINDVLIFEERLILNSGFRTGYIHFIDF